MSSQNGPTIHHIIYYKISHTWLPWPIFCHSHPLLLVYLCIKFGCCLSLCPQSTLSHLDHVQFQIFMSIPSNSHGRGFWMIFVVDCSVHYEFLSQLCLLTQQFVLVGHCPNTQTYLTFCHCIKHINKCFIGFSGFMYSLSFCLIGGSTQQLHLCFW